MAFVILGIIGALVIVAGSVAGLLISAENDLADGVGDTAAGSEANLS